MKRNTKFKHIIFIVLMLFSLVTFASACDDDGMGVNSDNLKDLKKAGYINDANMAMMEDVEGTADGTSASPAATTAGTPGDEPVRFVFIGNDNEVFNGGTTPSFTITGDYRVAELWTYHWNGGKGAPAGTLSIVSDDGTVYGPWQAELVNGVYWAVKAPFDLPKGSYTVNDSDPATLSQNKETGGMGMTWLVGTPR